MSNSKQSAPADDAPHFIRLISDDGDDEQHTAAGALFRPFVLFKGLLISWVLDLFLF